jgi:hypothetical protein
VPLGRYATAARAKLRCEQHFDEMRRILKPADRRGPLGRLAG